VAYPDILGLVDGDVVSASHLDSLEGAVSRALWVCTSGTRPSSPAEGTHIYETDTDLCYVCTNAAGPVWTKVLTGSVSSAEITNGAIVDADVNAAAAVAYSKLNLSGSIVNADINASAAIAYSKLGAFPSFVLGRGGTVAVTASMVTALAYTAETRDTDGFHATNSASVVIPAGLGGLYIIGYNTRFAAGTSGSRLSWVDVNSSGTADPRLFENALTSAVAGSLTGFGLVPLSAGDTIRHIVYSTGATINWGDSTLVDRFYGVRICT
jgi:hypothetical protein